MCELVLTPSSIYLSGQFMFIEHLLNQGCFQTEPKLLGQLSHICKSHLASLGGNSRYQVWLTATPSLAYTQRPRTNPRSLRPSYPGGSTRAWHLPQRCQQHVPSDLCPPVPVPEHSHSCPLHVGGQGPYSMALGQRAQVPGLMGDFEGAS